MSLVHANGTTEFGELQVWEEGPGGSRQVTYPTYCCGHCSNVVILNPARKRERKKCMACGKLICEQNQLCQTDCTPIHALAAGRFEDTGKWGRLVPAIMAGCTSEEEGVQKGLIVPA